MLSEHIQKVKSWCASNKSDLYVAAIIFLTAMVSFGLGRLSAVWPEKEPITITGNQEARDMNQENLSTDKETNNPDSKFLLHDSTTKGRYVASKSGTAYHFPWCPGALKIKEENKVWFDTANKAEKAGYKPAGNCEGL